MKDGKNNSIKYFIIPLTLKSVDAITTYILQSNGSKEGNPLMSYFLEFNPTLAYSILIVVGTLPFMFLHIFEKRLTKFFKSMVDTHDLVEFVRLGTKITYFMLIGFCICVVVINFYAIMYGYNLI